MSDAETFVRAARRLLGTPWRHRGRNHRGVDCIGLVDLSLVAAGGTGLKPNAAESRYGREPWDDLLRKGCVARWGTALWPSLAQVGDIPLVRWGRGQPSHMGIVGDHPDGGLTLIHAHNLHGVIEQGLRGPILEAVVEIYRPRWAHGTT